MEIKAVKAMDKHHKYVKNQLSLFYLISNNIYK